MITLGLSLAHDAGIAIVEDGRVHALVTRERWSRKKRCALLTADFIQDVLARAGLAWSDIDHVAVASAQSWPFLFVGSDRFRIAYDNASLDLYPLSDATKDGARRGIVVQPIFKQHLRERLAAIKDGLYSEYMTDDLSRLTPENDALWCREWAFFPSWWKDAPTADTVARACASIPSLHQLHQGYLPISATLDGITKPGLIVPHHFAHAAYAYYQSDCDEAVVMTTDNGDTHTEFGGYVGGIFAKGVGNRLIPITPTFAIYGHVYQRVAEYIDLGGGSGAGKLMGLAPYGKPRFADRTMLGDAFSAFDETYALVRKYDRNQVITPIIQRVVELAKRLYPDPMAPVGNLETGSYGQNDMRRRTVDVAATAQWLFEENSLADVRKLSTALIAAGQWCPTLLLGGGAALNCPANSRIHDEGPFAALKVPPACDDSGLPIGAAQAVIHDVFGIAREPQGGDTATSAYLGMSYTRADLDRALAGYGGDLVVNDQLDAADDAGKAVASGTVVGWFEGRSEIGPRALGHRSLLADPRPAANWRRVNDLKRREAWRPFAPAVLAERAGDWFLGGPASSPHMLFTAQVKGDKLPAITHVDGSARVQTVGSETGQFRRVIEAFDEATGVPVVLNTSFNGPGEPIVETPDDALRFLATTEVDAVYVDGVKVTRRAG
ncbi:carbamoyltransferase, NodU family protein [alpha proteobacterium BAL199]|jgi:carbamoyltransferase|nr:carbamoyltransferase, NodU family protein [alpha proteobacterium BAL199]